MRRQLLRNAALVLGLALFLGLGVAGTMGASTSAVTISPGTLPSATVGSAYSQTISVSGSNGPYTVKVTQGSLPAGLSLGSNGTLSGTPTASGTFQFTVSAFDKSGAYAGFHDYYHESALVVAASSSPTPVSSTVTINPSSLPSGTAGSAYSQTISVSGPTPPYTVRVTQGSLPSGLSLSSGGSLSGTPSVSGSFRFTVSAYTSAGTYAAFRDYTLSIASGTTTTSPSGSLYFGDDFESGITSPWSESGASNQFALVSGWTGKAVQLTDYGSSSSGAGSAGSQMSALWFNGNYALAHASQGQDTWYHLKLYFPSTYQPTTGQWNWAVEWHIDGTTQSSCSSAVSVALGVYTDYPVVTNAYGKNPRLALRLAGGSCSSPTMQSIQLPSNSLQRGHWYDLMFHFVWSTSSTTGLAEWWVDGSQQVSTHFPTLYSRNGSSSTNNFGFYNYRLAANWAASIAYDHVRIGSSQSSVQ